MIGHSRLQLLRQLNERLIAKSLTDKWDASHLAAKLPIRTSTWVVSGLPVIRPECVDERIAIRFPLCPVKNRRGPCSHPVDKRESCPHGCPCRRVQLCHPSTACQSVSIVIDDEEEVPSTGNAIRKRCPSRDTWKRVKGGTVNSDCGFPISTSVSVR